MESAVGAPGASASGHLRADILVRVADDGPGQLVHHHRLYQLQHLVVLNHLLLWQTGQRSHTGITHSVSNSMSQTA